mmetsp:Transcript_27036/g.57877  ORF Transcript_27036/g.57877 Transcript_27036/m.57877 type:complete len:214 (+) Transcript_27036:501-1142(+)
MDHEPGVSEGFYRTLRERDARCGDRKIEQRNKCKSKSKQRHRGKTAGDPSRRAGQLLPDGQAGLDCHPAVLGQPHHPRIDRDCLSDRQGPPGERDGATNETRQAPAAVFGAPAGQVEGQPETALSRPEGPLRLGLFRLRSLPQRSALSLRGTGPAQETGRRRPQGGQPDRCAGQVEANRGKEGKKGGSQGSRESQGAKRKGRPDGRTEERQQP